MRDPGPAVSERIRFKCTLCEQFLFAVSPNTTGEVEGNCRKHGPVILAFENGQFAVLSQTAKLPREGASGAVRASTPTRAKKGDGGHL